MEGKELRRAQASRHKDNTTRRVDPSGGTFGGETLAVYDPASDTLRSVNKAGLWEELEQKKKSGQVRLVVARTLHRLKLLVREEEEEEEDEEEEKEPQQQLQRGKTQSRKAKKREAVRGGKEKGPKLEVVYLVDSKCDEEANSRDGMTFYPFWDKEQPHGKEKRKMRQKGTIETYFE